jgi:hypothetical protein
MHRLRTTQLLSWMIEMASLLNTFKAKFEAAGGLEWNYLRCYLVIREDAVPESVMVKYLGRKAITKHVDELLSRREILAYAMLSRNSRQPRGQQIEIIK